MAQKNKKSLEATEKITNALMEEGKDISLRETSFLGLQPGDIISFLYDGGAPRLGIVVRSRRAQRGYFLSAKNNTLLNVYLIDSITDMMLRLTVSILYRNRIACTYKNTPKRLGVMLGAMNFRTFNASKISDILSITITKP
jgi:hypothetical protein